MKKQLSGLLAILTILGACQKNEVASLSEEATIHATIEDNDVTKTIMDESNNILWSENDQIIAFMKSSYGHKYQVKPSFVGKSYADFSVVSSGNGSDLSAGNAWDHNVVYYPFSENIECLKSGSNYALEVNLPTEQVYVPDSFANGSMAMVAVSENNNITFNNVLGAIKLQLKGTQAVKSIKIEGKNNEKLSGAAVVTAYTDGTKPAITMASDASTSVTLNCGAGVQLNESKSTEFIISLPPVLFSKGFTVKVTDADEKTYTVETDKANTVLRSSLLVMPDFKICASSGDDSGDEGEDIIRVGKVTVSETYLTLTTQFSYVLTAKITPIDATYQSVVWSSDNASVVTIDQSGVLTSLAAGTAIITAEAGGVTGNCTINVIAPTSREVKDYKVDDVSYGKGIVIGDVIWAPVNCGYEPSTSSTKGYPYGKLYQWGRKYGQGYSLYYDATVPDILEGPVSSKMGMKEEHANVFYTSTEIPNDWLYPQNDKLWNSGTELNPIKTEYDPCPNGWRVPTYAELQQLGYHKLKYSGDKRMHYFFGEYSDVENAPSILLPTAGERSVFGGEGWRGEGDYGHYWSSTTDGNDAYRLGFDGGSAKIYGYSRAHGFSVRCVQE